MSIAIEWGRREEEGEKQNGEESANQEAEKGCMCVFSSVGCRVLMMEKRDQEKEIEERSNGGKGKGGHGRRKAGHREVFFWSDDGCDLLYLSGKEGIRGVYFFSFLCV